MLIYRFYEKVIKPSTCSLTIVVDSVDSTFFGALFSKCKCLSIFYSVRTLVYIICTMIEARFLLLHSILFE